MRVEATIEGGGEGLVKVASKASRFVTSIRQSFEAADDPQRAAPMIAYFRHNFPFHGIPKPRRAVLDAGPLRRWEGFFPHLEADVRLLWSLPQREYQYTALSLLARPRNLDLLADAGVRGLDLLEHCLRTRPWWDTVDTLAATPLGYFMRRNPQFLSTLDAWNQDEQSMWVRRATIIWQLKSPAPDEECLFRYILARAHESDFFIRKAIGWALRQYAKHAPHTKQAVRNFLAEHGSKLSPLSVREASKYLDK